MDNNKLLPGEKYFQEVRTITFRKEEFSGQAEISVHLLNPGEWSVKN